MGKGIVLLCLLAAGAAQGEDGLYVEGKWGARALGYDSSEIKRWDNPMGGYAIGLTQEVRPVAWLQSFQLGVELSHVSSAPNNDDGRGLNMLTVNLRYYLARTGK